MAAIEHEDGIAAVRSELHAAGTAIADLQGRVGALEASPPGRATTWSHTIEPGASFTIDDAAHQTWIESTHSAGAVEATLSAATAAGREGGIIKNTGTSLLVVLFASGATQVLPQDAANAEALNLSADHGLRWHCLDNVSGNAARYLLEIIPQRHANQFSGGVPEALAAEHSTWTFRIDGNGTTTIPPGNTLRRGFVCTIVNKPGSGFTRTLQGPAGSVSLAAGQTATISVLDDLSIVVSTGANTLVS